MLFGTDGQTGAGKTFTMYGAGAYGAALEQTRGLTPRVLDHLFALMARDERKARDEPTSNVTVKYKCTASMLEIYNEKITDLLDGYGEQATGGAAIGIHPMAAGPAKGLRLRDDASGRVYVENISHEEVCDTEDAMKMLAFGAAKRSVGKTDMNAESSRSHLVFTLNIQEDRTGHNGVKRVRTAQFNLVDLAGSESQKSTNASGAQLREACSINKSLSHLGNVITALSSGTGHVPYRDSKLTYLLKDSLGGNAKTCIIANVSPLACHFSETFSTLRFVQRARLITNRAVVNEDCSGSTQALQAEIARLKTELANAAATTLDRRMSMAPVGRQSMAPMPHRQSMAPMPRRISMAPREQAGSRLPRLSLGAEFSPILNRQLGAEFSTMAENGSDGVRISRLQSLLLRFQEQMTLLSADRDAAHNQLQGYGSVLDAKEQQVTQLRMQLKLSRASRSGAKATSTSTALSATSAAGTPSDKTGGSRTPAAERRSMIGRPTARGSSTTAATAAPPVTAVVGGDARSAGEVILSAAELAAIEARAVEASGLKAAVLKLTHEKEVAEGLNDTYKAKLAKLSATAAAAEIEKQAKEISALRAELADSIKGWAAEKQALTIDAEVAETAKMAATQAKEDAEQRLADAQSKSESMIGTLTTEYDTVIGELIRQREAAADTSAADAEESMPVAEVHAALTQAEVALRVKEEELKQAHADLAVASKDLTETRSQLSATKHAMHMQDTMHVQDVMQLQDAMSPIHGSPNSFGSPLPVLSSGRVLVDGELLTAVDVEERHRFFETEIANLELALKKESGAADKLRFQLTILEETHDELEEAHGMLSEQLQEANGAVDAAQAQLRAATSGMVIGRAAHSVAAAAVASIVRAAARRDEATRVEAAEFAAFEAAAAEAAEAEAAETASAAARIEELQERLASAEVMAAGAEEQRAQAGATAAEKAEALKAAMAALEAEVAEANKGAKAAEAALAEAEKAGAEAGAEVAKAKAETADAVAGLEESLEVVSQLEKQACFPPIDPTHSPPMLPSPLPIFHQADLATRTGRWAWSCSRPLRTLSRLELTCLGLIWLGLALITPCRLSPSAASHPLPLSAVGAASCLHSLLSSRPTRLALRVLRWLSCRLASPRCRLRCKSSVCEAASTPPGLPLRSLPLASHPPTLSPHGRSPLARWIETRLHTSVQGGRARHQARGGDRISSGRARHQARGGDRISSGRARQSPQERGRRCGGGGGDARARGGGGDRVRRCPEGRSGRGDGSCRSGCGAGGHGGGGICSRGGGGGGSPGG